MLNHGSLFSGIGGFDLAAERVGFENIFQVEKDSFCQKVLEKNFPKVKRYGDIKEFDGTKYRGAVDIISGGFPCQPFSVTGFQNGKNDDRYLWPEMLRVIKQAKPRFVVGENVTGIVDLALDEVLASLEIEGYTTETFIIPACALDAPHQRNRVWIIAYATSQGLQGCYEKREDICLNSGATFPFNSNANVFKGGSKLYEYSQYIRECNGLSRGLDKHRVKAIGNSIVPQIAQVIFESILHSIHIIHK